MAIIAISHAQTHFKFAWVCVCVCAAVEYWAALTTTKKRTTPAEHQQQIVCLCVVDERLIFVKSSRVRPMRRSMPERHIATLRKAENTAQRENGVEKNKIKETVSNKNIVSVWCPFERNRPSLLCFELEQDRASHRQRVFVVSISRYTFRWMHSFIFTLAYDLI